MGISGGEEEAAGSVAFGQIAEKFEMGDIGFFWFG